METKEILKKLRSSKDLTIQEVAEKRFEFLREGKCTPEEIMLEEVDNMIKIIERYYSMWPEITW